MELWLSAEVQDDVGEALRQARNKVSKVVFPKVSSDYGAEVQVWALITILRPRIPDGWGEVTKYHRQDRTAEFRLIIDYQAFKVASPEMQVQMLMRSILRSVELFPLLKVVDFDIDRFRRDIMDAAVAGSLIPPQLPATTA